MSEVRGRPKVVHVIPLYGLGGAPNTASLLASHHDLERFHIAVLAIRMRNRDPDWSSFAASYLKRLEEKQIPVRLLDGFNSACYPRNCFALLPYTVRLGIALSRMRPDIIVLHGFPGRFLGVLTARLACPASAIVLVVRDEIPAARLHLLRKAARRVTVRLLDCFVAVGEAVAESIRTQMPVGPTDVQVITNGWDLDRFFPADHRMLEQDSFSILSAARLVPKKDHVTLLLSMKHLTDQGGLTPARLVLAGDGPCRPRLEALAGELGLREQVEFLGARPRLEVAELMRKADAFVLLTEREGLPGALVEAMASALPVVATAIPPVMEVITHGVTGLLVPPRDPAAVASALQWIRTHPVEAKKMGLVARQRALAFDVAKTARGYEALFERLLKQPPPCRARRNGRGTQATLLSLVPAVFFGVANLRGQSWPLTWLLS